jgi:hypothetical protein
VTLVIADQDAPTQTLGAHGEPCPGCAAPLAADQRYCLNCGRRRAAARVPYADLLAGRAPDEVLAPMAPPPPPPTAPARRPLPSTAVVAGAAAASAFVLGVGVLIGAAATGPEQPRQVAAVAPVQKPPVINVNAGPAAPQEFTSDWPDGEEGWTVQLSTLSKDSSQVTDVATAKSDAQGKGASDVGALDSDDWASLDPGEYVVYSGVFSGKDAKAKAKAALKQLKAKFPDAKVVQVSAGDVPGAEGTKPEEKPQEVDKSTLQDLQGSTGADQQKKSAKLPPTLELGGKAPPKDDKQAGGGTDTEVIQ